MSPLALPIPLATSSVPMLVIWAIVIGGMFVMLRRPMKRQQEQQRQLQSSMQPGTRVMLTSGLFGTITHLGDKQAIVELAPGLEVTVLRQALSKVVQPDEEEFEFADEADDADQVGVDGEFVAPTDSVSEAPRPDADQTSTPGFDGSGFGASATHPTASRLQDTQLRDSRLLESRVLEGDEDASTAHDFTVHQETGTPVTRLDDERSRQGLTGDQTH